jgi:hypothetical protein
VRFIVFAMFLTGDLLRECALSSRKSAFDQDRRLRRPARLVGIAYLPKKALIQNVKRSSSIGSGRIDYRQALFFVPASLCFGKLRAVEVEHEKPNGR